LIPIFLIVVVDVLALTIMLPLLPFYAERLGATPTAVGALIATYALCQLVAGPALGSLSDHIGRRPVLLASQIGTFIGLLILAWAPYLWVVFLSRAIDGLTAGNLSIAQAYIADVSKPEERARSFAVIGIAFGIGFLIGPAISGFLSQFGYVYPVFAAAALSAASICATYFLLPESPPAPAADGPAGRRLSILEWSRYVRFFRNPSLGPLLWKFFIFVFSFGFFTAGFALFAERRYTWHGRPFGPKEVGYIFAYTGLVGGLIQGMMGRLVRRFGESRLLAAGFIASVIGYGALAFAVTVPELILVTTISVLGGVIRPVVTSLITQRAARNEQGVVLGLTQSLASVAQIVAPLIAGALIQKGWLAAWALAMAAVALVGVMIRTPESVIS
jgi:DHA1 family tetracycline resistance protein-like MFS transporter